MTQMNFAAPGNFLSTSEALARGHPDKIADQVAEALVDAYLEQDPESSLSIEVVTKTGFLMLLGSISSNATIDFERVVRGTVKHIGYDASDKGLDYKSMEVVNRLDMQHRDEWCDHTAAAAQGMFIGYATDETPEMVPLPHQLATRLCQVLDTAQVRMKCPWLRCDGKAQVTLEYSKSQDGALQPIRVHTVVVSVQHAPDVPVDRLQSDILEHVIKRAIPSNLIDSETQILVNPSGRFVIGGPRGDAGVSGRQGLADSCGASAAHTGSATSGNDGYKVQRCGTYAARWMAKSLVQAGFASRCSVQLAYASGKAEPLSVSVDSYGSARAGKSDADLCALLKEHFDLRPGALVRDLQLRKPQFLSFATFGHCGRSDPTPMWEKCKDLTGEAQLDQANKWQ